MMEKRQVEVKKAQDAYMQAIIDGADFEEIERLYDEYVRLHNTYFGRDAE